MFNETAISRPLREAKYRMDNSGVELVWVIDFEVEGDITITKCPRGDNSNVGSCGCRICPYHLYVDMEKRQVRCI